MPSFAFFYPTCGLEEKLWQHIHTFHVQKVTAQRTLDCFAACCFLQPDRFDSGSVMVWTGKTMEAFMSEPEVARVCDQELTDVLNYVRRP